MTITVDLSKEACGRICDTYMAIDAINSAGGVLLFEIKLLHINAISEARFLHHN
jgi:hypothetical protein